MLPFHIGSGVCGTMRLLSVHQCATLLPSLRSPVFTAFHRASSPSRFGTVPRLVAQTRALSSAEQASRAEMVAEAEIPKADGGVAQLRGYAGGNPLTSAGPLRLRGVVFDMDGTLTVPCIDFAEMRRRVGATSPDILHEIDGWDAARRAEAYRVIGEMEADAKRRLQIMPGARELCSFLDSRNIKRGLITRNVKDSVDHFHTHLEIPPFSPALSREFTPYKPHAAPLLHICAQWGVDTSEVIMIGDSAKDDVVCGKRAGAITCLLDERGIFPSIDEMPEEIRPHFHIRNLSEMLDLLMSSIFVLH